ncbi:uncharacterized protein LOC100370142 [Saccoglossus kowalevskii]|uniref:Uncharacterized protein LOC100370142 n=1 Tax=Saccoglossus kowalevskii TaxID=10224 RepID=A0ABM0GIG8_SACKO|nr:PREDICTED: uncharacterized protein LOC100370142 [Saccoglossus kowalevskii]
MMFVYRKLMARRRQDTNAAENGTEPVNDNKEAEESKVQSPKKVKKQKAKPVKVCDKNAEKAQVEEKGQHTQVETYISRIKYNDTRFNNEPDFSLHTEDIEFRIHSSLLKEKSEYIQKALSAEAKCIDSVGKGHGIEFVKPPPTARALRILMDYVYTEKMIVADDEKQEVYIAARVLGIQVDEEKLIGWNNPK